MYTVTYYPTDYGFHFTTKEGDKTALFNNHAWNEAPSFCVRLWVFDPPSD